MHQAWEKLRDVWRLVSVLPVYRDLDIDWSQPVEQSEPLFWQSRPGFLNLLDFLEVEFFRGRTAGNAPRRCHNCGKYFLLTAGYNTCYCNNIAPGETERTCRKVGAHRKEEREKAGRPQRRSNMTGFTTG